jgi:RHH-type proline utilization regulon transcriptional repressor/proline dehydrogenase/delta 1-pyrroline-5-carboxylate dehydrogenase
MSTQQHNADFLPNELADETVTVVRRWLKESASAAPDKSAERLAGVLKDPKGLDFTLGFVDRVVRPEDLRVAGRNLERLSRSIPSFLPWYLRGAIAFGGGFAPQFPWLIVPIARRALRDMVSHLVIDATPKHLDETLAKLREEGTRLNLNLLGEAVLGEAEADRRLAGTRALLNRDDVDYVSIKVSSVVSQLSMWAYDETVERVVKRLTPLYKSAAAASVPKFINLDMEEFRDLDLTIEVFQRILEQPELKNLEAGIVLQAYLPDALAALQRLTAWAQARRASGGAAIKVRVVKGANLAMEHVDAIVHGWPLATWSTKVETDTNYKRVLDWALTPDHIDAVHIGVAGHNLFDVAFAWLLAKRRGVEAGVDFEMLLGMATGQADAVKRDVGGLLLYTPVVHPREFDSAISYLVRRLEENASTENFMSGLFELVNNEAVFRREEERFRASLVGLDQQVPESRRTQDRTRPLAGAGVDAVVLNETVAEDIFSEVTLPPESITEEELQEQGGEESDDPSSVASTGDNGVADELIDGGAGVADGDADLTDVTHGDADLTELADGDADADADADAAADAGTDVDAETDVDATTESDNVVAAEIASVDEVLVPVASAASASTDRRFRNEPDTDPAIAANRVWGRRVIERSEHSTIGRATIAVARVTSSERLDRLIEVTARTGDEWGALPASERSRVLHDVGDVIAAFRGRLVEVMAIETGKTIAEADVEVSEAVDFAHYYAERALDVESVTGATFVPPRLTVVTPPWNFPVAIPAGSVLAALAVGSGVMLKPAPQARRCAAVLMEAMWEAGISQELLTLVDIEEGDLGQQLVSHPAVDRVILTGGWDTAKLFRSWRNDLPLLAETSGKNAIIVTPSADLDLAVADVVKSAFGHAGQKCSAASLVILVGSVASSERFRRQLIDAVRSLRVGYPQDLTAQMGPIIEPAAGKLLGALTTLGPGQKWMVKPTKLDGTGRLWSPGVRERVTAGSEFHLTEYFGPVLGVMTAATLDEAIELQNASDFGLTAGIHSLDADEVGRWIDTVDAGNLYVNRGITGAIVRRQPFGGWKRSSVGTGAKAGGPNYLLTLGSWLPVETAPTSDLRLDGLSRDVAKVIKRSQEGIEYLEFDRVRRAAQNDEKAWLDEFGVARDVSALGVERNVFRYRPAPVTLRLSEGVAMGDLIRLVVAATRARSPIAISSALPLPTSLVELFADPASPLTVSGVAIETDERWHDRLRAGELSTGRIRLIGGDAAELATVLGGDPDVAIYAGAVTTAGRVELLPFLHEQAISVTAHRFGNPDREMADLRI